MEIKESELNRLPFKVIGNIDYRKEYPHLLDIPEFRPEFTKQLPIKFDPYFKYIVLLYSQNTPLLNIRDFEQRKRYAIEYADIKDPESFFIDFSEYKDDEEQPPDEYGYLNQVFIAYLRFMKSNKWSKLYVFQNSYYNLMGLLQSGKTSPGERTRDLIQNIDSIGVKIDELITDLTNQHWTPKIESDILQAIEDVRHDLRPEYIAQQLLEGNDVTRKWGNY